MKNYTNKAYPVLQCCSTCHLWSSLLTFFSCDIFVFFSAQQLCLFWTSNDQQYFQREVKQAAQICLRQEYIYLYIHYFNPVFSLRISPYKSFV